MNKCPRCRIFSFQMSTLYSLIYVYRIWNAYMLVLFQCNDNDKGKTIVKEKKNREVASKSNPSKPKTLFCIKQKCWNWYACKKKEKSGKKKSIDVIQARRIWRIPKQITRLIGNLETLKWNYIEAGHGKEASNAVRGIRNWICDQVVANMSQKA